MVQEEGMIDSLGVFYLGKTSQFVRSRAQEEPQRSSVMSVEQPGMAPEQARENPGPNTPAHRQPFFFIAPVLKER